MCVCVSVTCACVRVCVCVCVCVRESEPSKCASFRGDCIQYDLLVFWHYGNKRKVVWKVGNIHPRIVSRPAHIVSHI